jgi:type IV pilus biogenesis/stability protein PilW
MRQIKRHTEDTIIKRALTVLLTCILCSCASVSEKDTQQATAHYQLGVSYLNDGNIQPAFVELQRALELNPRDKEIHNAIGVIYLVKLEDYPKAIQHFQEALKIDKNYPEAANNLGNAYANVGDYPKAIESFRMALSNPQYKNAAMALNNLGMVYYRLSRYDEAMDAFKESMKRFSDSPLPYYGLALTYNAKGQYGDAAFALSRAVQLDPAYQGNKEKAIEDFKDKKMRARGEQEKDMADYLDIMNY